MPFFRALDDSSAPLPCVEVLYVDGINEDLPQVALLFHLLLLFLQQTHDTKSSLPEGTANVIFAPDDSMAYF